MCVNKGEIYSIRRENFKEMIFTLHLERFFDKQVKREKHSSRVEERARKKLNLKIHKFMQNEDCQSQREFHFFSNIHEAYLNINELIELKSENKKCLDYFN